jgi:hypothetical protein
MIVTLVVENKDFLLNRTVVPILRQNLHFLSRSFSHGFLSHHKSIRRCSVLSKIKDILKPRSESEFMAPIADPDPK